ncbi:chymotrypsin-1-like [Phlebotomus argentipes]|uniref:chymotrypsin-1-like n=1 Tax=Phlebotomus argentipes TaxID=94469 RepID=UPI002892FD5A|nr:chymotrypsin-1-like [Phlebotomus argentipes]
MKMIRQVCLVLLLCTVGVFSRTLEVQDDWAANWEGFIVGGQNANAGQFPHVVSLRSTANNHFCGAFIVNNRWVVSAAHCTINRTPGNTWIIVGALQLSTGGTNVFTSSIVNHPGYVGSTLANDISCLQTQATLTWSGTVNFLEMGSNFIGGGAQATAAGWGRVGANLPLANTLQWLNVNTMTNDDCRNAHNAVNRQFVHDNTICTFTRQGEGMCNGDSGSALFIGNSAIGVVSWGIPCAQGFPDNFARVSSHRAWLVGHTG